MLQFNWHQLRKTVSGIYNSVACVLAGTSLHFSVVLVYSLQYRLVFFIHVERGARRDRSLLTNLQIDRTPERARARLAMACHCQGNCDVMVKVRVVVS